MTIFVYHSLTDDWEDDLAVQPEDFAWQMKTLAGMHPLALPDYISALRERRLPKGAVAVTFDDGYANNIHVALPICERFGIRPALFLAVGHIDSGEPIGWRPETRECNRPLTWDEVRRLRDAGWTIGSHTMRHSDLVTTPDDRLAWELSESRRRIAEVLGTDCEMISYPYGRQDERVRQATRKAGYDAALSLPNGREYTDDRMAIPRIGVFLAETPFRFRAKARGIALWWKLNFRRSFAPQGSDRPSQEPTP